MRYSHFWCAVFSVSPVVTCWNNRPGQVEFSTTRRKVDGCCRQAALAPAEPSTAVNDKLAAVSTVGNYNRVPTVTQYVRQHGCRLCCRLAQEARFSQRRKTWQNLFLNIGMCERR